ncbi:MAG: M23 family metallopeptidase [Pseudomonadota bacterium]
MGAPSRHRSTLLLAGLMIGVTVTGCARKEWAPVYYGSPPHQRVAETSGLGDSPSGQTVIVRHGDSLSMIAARYDVSQSALIRANGIRDPNLVRPGQRLRLPRPASHTVRSGDTLYHLSRTYDVPVTQLASHNGLNAPYVLRPGQRLRLPGAATAGGAFPPDNSMSHTLAGITAPPRAKPAYDGGTGGPYTPLPTRKATYTPDASGQTTVGPRAKPSGFIWPARGKVISRFGSKGGGLRNDGINIALNEGAPIYSAGDGVVRYTGAQLKQFGNLILIEHAGGWISAYAHNSRILVSRGERVVQGQQIAKAGKTGSVKTAQLHFELRHNGDPKDPARLLGGS